MSTTEAVEALAEAMSLNRRLIRAVHPELDWDQYDKEVIADHEAAQPASTQEVERKEAIRITEAVERGVAAGLDAIPRGHMQTMTHQQVARSVSAYVYSATLAALEARTPR